MQGVQSSLVAAISVAASIVVSGGCQAHAVHPETVGDDGPDDEGHEDDDPDEPGVDCFED